MPVTGTSSLARPTLSTRLDANRLHRLSALLVGGFALLHVLNHLFVLGGPALHQQVMELLRLLYRSPPAEALLYGAIAAQVTTGWVLFTRARGARGEARWRRYSGAYLGFFMVAHGLAAQYQRHFVGLDSNFYWAAAVLEWPPVLWYAPYYTLGLVSLVVHIGCVLRVRAAHSALLGVALSAVVIAALGGLLYPIEIPAAYRQ